MSTGSTHPKTLVTDGAWNGPVPEPEQPGLVSVIIIFLNEERFLRDAVESVLTQDHAAWELLLVDDGSTDDSPRIARAFAGQHDNIRYLTHPGGENRGMSASRNLGLAHARGEYVAFLDADDVYLPQRLSRHVEVLDAHPSIAMAGSSYIRWFSESSTAVQAADIANARPFVVAGDLVWNPPLGLIVVTTVPYLNMGTCSLTVRRRVALEVGGFEDSFRGLYEDQVFASKILARYPVYVLQAYLALYRHHGASATRKAKSAAAASTAPATGDSTRFVDWLLGYLDRHGVDDPLLLDMVRSRRAREAEEPGRLGRLRKRAGAGIRTVLAGTLPHAWHRRLLVLDYTIDGVQARRAYQRLTRTLSRRALTQVLREES